MLKSALTVGLRQSGGLAFVRMPRHDMQCQFILRMKCPLAVRTLSVFFVSQGVVVTGLWTLLTHKVHHLRLAQLITNTIIVHFKPQRGKFSLKSA
jgi:hypothetical protein